jgi:pilus assembly protein CpaE
MTMRVVVAQEQTGSSAPVRELLLGMGLECSAGDCVTFADLPVRLAQNRADLVLVQAAGDPTAPLETLRQALPLTRSPIMVVGPAADASQILRYLQGGAREYLDEAQLQVNLERALDKLRLSGTLQQGQGVVVGVMSATPGSGVTMVALNLAFAWADRQSTQVALVELGRGPADVALFLDLTPRHTVADVHQNWERLDATLLRGSMFTHPDKVDILAYPFETLDSQPLLPQAVRKSVLLLRTMYPAAVLDLGHFLGEEQVEALRLCELLAVVVRLDVPGLRQARRFLTLLHDRGVPRERIRAVANRYGQRGQLAWKKAEETLGMSFAEYIVDDTTRVNLALEQAQPLVKVTRHGITRRFFKLVDMLNAQARSNPSGK